MMNTSNIIPVRFWRRFPRLFCRPETLALVPTSGLEYIDDITSQWQATDTDPQFQFECVDDHFWLPAGWYRLRCQVSGPVTNVRLYPMYSGSDGYQEETSIVLPTQPKKLDEVFRLSAPVERLRFDPCDIPEKFNLTDIELSKIGRLQVVLHQMPRFLRFLLETRRRMGFWRMLSISARAFTRVVKQHGFWSAIASLYVNSRKIYTTDDAYSRWIGLYDRGDDIKPLQTTRTDPLISVLLPVYNTPKKWLEKCLDSVRAQTWPHWELCIVDDMSTNAQVHSVLKEYAQKDARIRLHFRESNGHISVATNDALNMATGEFIVLLDHDDELRPHSLQEVANAVHKNPAIDFIYTDEDKIDENGHRFNPYFKPDWNPDLLLSQNYICHMVAIRRTLALAVGGVRQGYEGSQDHDLFLRCTAALDPSRIHHIPKILYHWRAIEGSTASGINEKSYALEAGIRTISDHLVASGTGARVALLPDRHHYRVKWPIPTPTPKVSLVIPTRDRVDLLKVSVGSILEKTSYANYQIVIVNNQSTDPETLAYLDDINKQSNVRVIPYDAPFNYAAINNFAVKQLTDTEVMGLLNNDIEVIHADWLDEMVSHAIRPGIGAVGAMLYYPDDTIQHAGVILGTAYHVYCRCPRGFPGMAGRALLTQNLSAVTGACLVVTRERYLECGGMDEEHLKVAFNDVDFCLRLLEAGYRNVWTPFAELYHHESASRGYEDTPEKQARFASEVHYLQTRWHDILIDDPAYNPNLKYEDVLCSLAFPPRVRK